MAFAFDFEVIGDDLDLSSSMCSLLWLFRITLRLLIVRLFPRLILLIVHPTPLNFQLLFKILIKPPYIYYFEIRYEFENSQKVQIHV
jgi:hypothetical protein